MNVNNLNLVMRVHIADEGCIGDADYCYVQITPSMGVLMLRRLQALKAQDAWDSQLAHIAFFDNSPYFIQGCPEVDKWINDNEGAMDLALGDCGWTVIDDQCITETTPLCRVDTTELILSSNGFHWTTFIKHTSPPVIMITPIIRWNLIEGNFML